MLKAQQQISKNDASKSTARVTKMSIFKFIGHILMVLFENTDNWRQICKQRRLTFYVSNDVLFQSNLLRRTKKDSITRTFL